MQRLLRRHKRKTVLSSELKNEYNVILQISDRCVKELPRCVNELETSVYMDLVFSFDWINPSLVYVQKLMRSGLSLSRARALLLSDLNS